MLHRRFVPVQLTERPLPLFLDSIGRNPAQEPLQRREGYHVYHWLQTVQGQGIASFGGRTEAMPADCGLLLPPGVPHAYEDAGGSVPWETLYITFGGSWAAELLGTLGLAAPAQYRWESGAPLSSLLEDRLTMLEGQSDPLGLESSQTVYAFLLSLQAFARPDTGGSSRVLSRLKELEPLLAWLEERLADPDLGLGEMASQAGVSGRRLHTLFRDLFGISPYSYLLRLRIRRARELLVSRPDEALSVIGQQAGFRDVSHFIATFRKQTGETPDRFRSSRN
jgi:AraC-like DNA-binding protein